MTTHPLPHYQVPRLRLFTLIALNACASCGGEPVPPAAHSRGYVDAARSLPGTAASPARRLPSARPDPRYRTTAGFSELREIAAEVALASGRKIHWQIQAGSNPGPLIQIGGSVENCTIFVHPIAPGRVPPNTWAFLFGHEFAHMTESLGKHSATNPSNELKADIVGARYAMAAGYRIEAFLGWVLTEPDQQTASHGSLHRRVHAIAAHFGIPQAVIQEESRRASRYRTSR